MPAVSVERIVRLQLELDKVGAKVKAIGTSVWTWQASLAEVDGKDVAAWEGAWRKQEEAVIQSAVCWVMLRVLLRMEGRATIGEI